MNCHVLKGLLCFFKNISFHSSMFSEIIISDIICLFGCPQNYIVKGYWCAVYFFFAFLYHFT